MITNKINSWYQLDTGRGCSDILFKDSKVIASAPIFRKFLGQNYMSLFLKYKLTKCPTTKVELNEKE